MIVVTGGAGFIGSALVWKLNERGRDDILIVDHLGTSEKWRNLVSLRYDEYIDKSEFIRMLESGSFGNSIDCILHLGACSSTTETDADYLMENNYRYTARIARWWENHRNTRLIYASSAATYGDGDQGYVDDIDKIGTLRPLNIYGYSKHLFDLTALRRGWLSSVVGLKYFNVFGPNEYHKGEMRSLINKSYRRVCDEGVISLFKSHRPDFKDGEQVRDFIYIKDAVAITLFFVDNPDIGGIYNVGTGRARSWNDLSRALFDAAGRKLSIEYVPIPPELQGKYQYVTQADLGRLRKAGCHHECMSLEDAVRDYVCSYLVAGKHLGQEPRKEPV